MKQMTVDYFETYLEIIKNSVGSKLFRHFYIKENNKKVDVLRNGELSCAFFVSSILKLFDLIDRPHGTVDNTLKQMEEKGWVKIRKNPQPGDIVVWESKTFEDGEEHQHIGFYIGSNKAISNNSQKRTPMRHSIDDKRRKVIGFYRFKDWKKL